jgi:hypothetical protein
MPAIAPGMTAANPLDGQPAAGQRTLRTDGVHRVLRATRRETAATSGPEEENQHGRNRPAVGANAKNQCVLGRFHADFSKPARRSVVRKSFSTSAKFFPAMEFRATSTSSTGCASSSWCCRKLSRNNRRARLRTTAPPIRRLVTTPNRGVAPSGNECQLAIRQPRARRCPCCRTRANSRCCRSRAGRRSRRRLVSGVRSRWAEASGDEAGMGRRIRRASGACALRGAGCAGWRVRFWSICGQGIRAAVCAGFWTVDTGVS